MPEIQQTMAVLHKWLRQKHTILESSDNTDSLSVLSVLQFFLLSTVFEWVSLYVKDDSRSK